MKGLQILAKSLLCCSVALVFSCSSCGESEQGKNSAPNNVDNNVDNNENAVQNSGNNGGDCVVSTDCPSRICNDGTCAPVDNNQMCDELSACGDCDPFCRLDATGPGTEDPFTLDDNDDETSQGVVLDPDGAVTIDITRIESHFIWISNTGEGTISKVDTRTFEEVARYISGPDGQSNDPSRTSVNTFGDVFVGNRSGRSLTKISGRGEECEDSNGDGVVTTSTSGTDVLPWGQDDCVLWNTRLPNGGIIRAVAAQDTRTNDDTSRPAVWAGGWDGVVYKLDSDRGDILVETPSPVQTYGFALDGKGNLWISGWSNGAIGRVDTNKCTTTANCDVQICEGEDQDACVKQRIPIGHTPYGITVDFKQRVWVGGPSTLRYDPAQPVGQRTVSVSDVPFIHGIAADDKGFIWGAGMGNGILRYDAEDPSQHIEVPGTNTSPKGMAIDLDGKIWAINQSHADATVVEAGPDLNTNTVTNSVVPTLISPYTYSDMTGAQLRFATDQRGFYRRVFQGCDPSGNFLPTEWSELRWSAETPGDSTITFRIRGAESAAGLAAAAWVDVATVPPDTSPLAIADLLDAAGLQGMLYIEIEAALEAVRDASNNVYAPKLKAMEITYSCERRVN